MVDYAKVQKLIKKFKMIFKKKGIDFITIDLTWNSPYVNTTVSATYKISRYFIIIV